MQCGVLPLPHGQNMLVATTMMMSHIVNCVLISDINMGEELTCDYDYFDTNWALFGLQ